MGEVYRAHGTTLNRDVALKVLLDAVVSDAQRAVAAFWLYVNLTSRPGSASLSAADPIA